MFQFPGFAFNPYGFRIEYLLLTIRSPTPQPCDHAVRIQIVEGGFPHSEIHGSKPVRGSPWLIAAYHVLHRLSAPRHPPDALLSLVHSHYRYPSARQRLRASVRPGRLHPIRGIGNLVSKRPACLSRIAFDGSARVFTPWHLPASRPRIPLLAETNTRSNTIRSSRCQ